MSRLCKEENQDSVRLLLDFLPKFEEFCVKFKPHLENYKYQDAIPSLIFQTTSLKLYQSAIKFYQNCCSSSKQKDLKTGILKVAKDLYLKLKKTDKLLTEDIVDQFSIMSEIAKLPLLLLKLERKIGNVLDTSKQFFDILQNNLKCESEKVLQPYINEFVWTICKYGNEKKNLELIDIAIDTQSLLSDELVSKLPHNLDKMWYIKFSIHYDMKDYKQALEDCKKRVKVRVIFTTIS